MMLNSTKTAFIRLALDCNALKFGTFELKSGRISPYFFNAGLFYEGMALQQLGRIYAQTLVDHAVSFDHLFGPAYKGLPLATTTAVALAEMGIHTTVTFNRKEHKSHGETGQLIGAPLTGKTIIVDDVITAGTAFREAQLLIQEHGGTVAGIIIALDRCERGLTEKSAVQEILDQGIPVYPILSVFELMDFLNLEGEQEKVKQLREHQQKYGHFYPE